jgi:hypothetical protein
MLTINNTDINFSPVGNSYFSTGKVGIGTTTPAKLLQLGNNSDGEVIRIGRTDNTHTVGIGSTGFNSNLLFFANGVEKMRMDVNGNVGINNRSPVATLQVSNGSVLFDGSISFASSSEAGTRGVGTPISGAGTRMMWIPSKAAFRTGTVDGTQWDDASIGIGSFASGSNTKASGLYSTASGNNATASGQNSFAINANTTASGNASFASGNGSTASGAFSAACGRFVTAQSYHSFVLGAYNVTGTYNATTWVATDPLFVIGNGTSAISESNAVTVLKNGNTGIGTISPVYKLDVNGAVNATQFLVNGVPLNTSAQWQPSGSNIYYNSGKVGIGTNAPTLAQLDIQASTNNTALYLKTSHTADYGYCISADVNRANTKAFVVTLNGAEMFKLNGNSLFYARGGWITAGNFPDYVFDEGYERASYLEKAEFFQKYKHLPEMKSAKEIEKNGLDLGASLSALTLNIEENSLDIIDLYKMITELKQENEKLKKEVANFKK